MGINREIIAVRTVKEGFNSCCKDLRFQIPKDLECNPKTGDITPKNQTGINCKEGMGSCYDYYRHLWPAGDYYPRI